MSQNQNSFKKCSKCNIAYDQDLGSSYSIEVGKQRRIFNKDGKRFCFNCLASEYNIDCQYCHKRINSKDELAYWGGGVISINGGYDYCQADDWVFTCGGCDEKIREKWKNGVKPSWHSGWGPILFPEQHIRKCRITGCSQKPYYECMDLCLPHSKPCKGGKIKPNGKICSAAMGSDEGDICEFCQNQTETYQQGKDRRDNESNQEFEKYQQAIEKAQSWWDSLSNEGRQREVRNLEVRLPAQIKKFWNSHGYSTDGNQTQGNAQYPHWDTFENGKLHQSDPTRVPWAIVNEFYEKGGGKIRKDNSSKPNPAAITNSNDKSDNSVKVNPGNSPQPNQEQDKSPESQIKTIKFENKENNSENSVNPASEKSSDKNNKTLVINLKNVKKITRTAEGNLVIEFNNQQEGNYSISQTITPDQIKNSQELQAVKNYLEKNNQTSLNQQELDKILSRNNNRSVSPEKPKDNNKLLIGGIVGGTSIIGIGIGLFLRKKQGRKKR